jgi:3-methyl-2-oxobutanoate hydroxymethyltransferase
VSANSGEEHSAISVPEVRARKGKTPLVCITAYTAPSAELADRHCDIILVGDSVGMVLHRLPSTLGVTMDMMILHGKAVRRGVKRALMVVDMPFGSYEESPAQAFANASTLMRETGCSAVKLLGGLHMAETISFLTERGIPVMGHVGLTPQSINAFGGYGLRGKDGSATEIMAGAQVVAEAGAFSVVLEKIPEKLARDITANVAVPTIGIGASPACDGQILVQEDMLGMFSGFKPKFVKRFAELAAEADRALAAYSQEVRERRFPGPEHVYETDAGGGKAK